MVYALILKYPICFMDKLRQHITPVIRQSHTAARMLTISLKRLASHVEQCKTERVSPHAGSSIKLWEIEKEENNVGQNVPRTGLYSDWVSKEC